jgi:hypothetical protein
MHACMHDSVLVVMVNSGSFTLGGVHAIEGVGWGCGGGAHGGAESKPSCNDACAMWPHSYHSTTRTDFFCPPIIQSSWWCSIDVRRCHHIIATTRVAFTATQQGLQMNVFMRACARVRVCVCCLLAVSSAENAGVVTTETVCTNHRELQCPVVGRHMARCHGRRWGHACFRTWVGVGKAKG